MKIVPAWAVILLIIVFAITTISLAEKRGDNSNNTDTNFQREAEESVKSLRECVTLAEKSVADFERIARSRNRWKARALAAENRSSYGG